MIFHINSIMLPFVQRFDRFPAIFQHQSLKTKIEDGGFNIALIFLVLPGFSCFYYRVFRVALGRNKDGDRRQETGHYFFPVSKTLRRNPKKKT